MGNAMLAMSPRSAPGLRGQVARLGGPGEWVDAKDKCPLAGLALIRWLDDRPGMATGKAIVGFGGGAFIATVAELAEPARHSSAATESYGALVRGPLSDGPNFVSDRQHAMRRRERFQH